MPELPVRVDLTDSIARITFNRPNACSALGPDMITVLAGLLEECRSGNPALLILTGTGRFFCRGVDFRGVKPDPVLEKEHLEQENGRGRRSSPAG